MAAFRYCFRPIAAGDAMKRPLLEVSVEGVDGLIVSQENGADRVELCASVLEGGITPSIGMVRQALRRATVPVFVIVRPRGGDFLYSEDEYESMRQDIIACRESGVPGVVTGCLTPDGQVDEERTAELLRLARPMGFTVHRAFDMVRDQEEALEVLIRLGVDRVLTSGQYPTALEGAANLKRLGEKAGERMIVMPCGSIRAGNVAQVIRETGLREFHFAGHAQQPSGMTYRNSQIAMGGASLDREYLKTVTDGEIVRTTVAAARSFVAG
jgi:copper homeostasis protein